jgi:hypothetical protein
VFKIITRVSNLHDISRRRSDMTSQIITKNDPAKKETASRIAWLSEHVVE